jgi:hypothetical protein
MNDRLRELMLEAGYAAPEIAGRAQRLVELVVQEAIHTVSKRCVGDHNREDQEAFRCVQDLKQHFGVG